MKNNPKYIYRSSLLNHTLLDQFYMNLIPYSRYARTVFNYEKSPFLCEFLDKRDTPLTFECTPREKNMCLILDKFDA